MEKITVDRLWSEMPGRVLFDVRTPSEYACGHIPGALNLPLFTDEERAVVGTAYKRQSPRHALLRGLEFAGARMAWYVREAMTMAKVEKIAVHCWRGGQRSGSLSWLLEFAGFDVQVLSGGYKAYRSHIHAEFSRRRLRLVILGGPTGSGKTQLLKALAQAGEQVIDLEQIACHKGSSFGALGEAAQPTVEQFENDFYEAFRQTDPGRRVWVENESRAIGRVFIPEGFWEQFRTAPLIEVDAPFESRVNYLVSTYGNFPGDLLKEAFLRLERRLGGQHCIAAVKALEDGDLATAAAIALRYYDKSYAHANSKCAFQPVIQLPIAAPADPGAASSLIKTADEYRI